MRKVNRNLGVVIHKVLEKGKMEGKTKEGMRVTAFLY